MHQQAGGGSVCNEVVRCINRQEVEVCVIRLSGASTGRGWKCV